MDIPKNIENPVEHSPTLARLKKLIVAVTGVLVVIPALINAGIDIYYSIQNIPASDSERTNLRLYERYMGKPAVFEGAVPVKTETGTLNISLEIYGGGDIFVRYGERSQWFPAPMENISFNFSAIEKSFAETNQDSQPSNTENFFKRDLQKGKLIQREYYLQDGIKKTYTIDPTTGQWSKPKIEHYEQLPEEATARKKIHEFSVLDLTNSETNNSN